MPGTGWVKLHRSIQNNWIWSADKSFDKAHAFTDIILSCNHADSKIAFDGKPMVIKRGEWLTSLLQLSERWGWSTKKVSNFLNILEQDQMISQERNTKRTLIKVLNYDTYQSSDPDPGKTKEQPENNDGLSKEHKQEYIKTNKNNKKNSFHNFHEREYDYDSLTAMVL